MNRLSQILLLTTALALFALSVSAQPMVGRGDFAFYFDRVAFKGEMSNVIEEVSIRIPNNEIAFRKDGNRFRSHVRVSVEILDAKGKPAIQDAQELEFFEEEESRTNTSVFFQTVIKRYQLKPGTYDLSYAVEDLLARKVSVVAMVTGRNKLSAVRNVRIHLPEFPSDVASFSEAKFLWEVDPNGDASRHHPNPPRLYGLHRDVLAVYMELYLPQEMARANTFSFSSELVTAAGDSMRVTRLELANPAPTDALVQTFPMLIREDLSKFPAGSYVLYITFHRDDGLVKRVRAGRFSVAWDMRSWEIPRREYLAEARFLLEDNGEFDRFKSLDTGEQERMLAEIWKKLDPAPETGVNESYDKFVARMAYVREHYTEDGTAVLSPRGELYLRFGAPDELVIDVIPLNRESLGEAMDMVQDKYDPVDFTNSGLTATSETDKSYERRSATNVLVDPRGLSKPREGDHVAYPYELWIYDRRGDPILPGDRSREMDVGMRYLFIDRTGHGQYELESSSAVSSK